MRILPLLTSASALMSAQVALAATASPSTPSSSSTDTAKQSPSASEKGIVPFLQVMQSAQISSMACLIALVNMTQNPIGSCLGLTQLAPLIVGGGGDTGRNTSQDFAGQLGDYLDGTCKGSGCTDAQLATGREQLRGACAGQQGNGLIPVLDAVMANYQSSFKTLACSVAYNGTQGNCLVDAFEENKAANSNQFFKDLIGGGNLGQYTDSVFKSAKCTGCMHELYKAAVFLLPAIRSQSITFDMGNHLKNDCGEGPPTWADVTDQQMPQALVVKQNPNSGGTNRPSAAQRGAGLPPGGMGLVVVAAALLIEVSSRKGYV